MKNMIKELHKKSIKREQIIIDERAKSKYSPSRTNVFAAVLVGIRGVWIDYTPNNRAVLRLNRL